MTTLHDVYINLGTIIRAALKAHRRTQHELAQQLGCSERTAHRKLNGQHGFKITELVDAAMWLGESVTDWLNAAGFDDYRADCRKLAL
ncbi:helix-turn-helix domain-containing protein [Rhodococcus jostii]|uniref:helix-turn-helix domain-containing protein n=1 Tax=Rhodococcus jostii TaxID=132919 RepID=UPI0036330C70